MELRDYWFKTATPALLVRMLSKTDGGIGDIVGNYYSANQLEEYRATENFPLPLIFQSGYLTVKEYDSLTESFRVDFPNDEVARGFVTLVANDYLRTRGKSRPPATPCPTPTTGAKCSESGPRPRRPWGPSANGSWRARTPNAHRGKGRGRRRNSP